MPRFLLDTQVIVHAYRAEGRLPPRVIALLEDAESINFVSVISITELALKTSIKKASMGEAEIRQAIRDLRLTILPFEANHAYKLCHLPLHHRDPFDRILIATALAEDIPLIGSDRQFKKYKGLKVIWS